MDHLTGGGTHGSRVWHSTFQSLIKVYRGYTMFKLLFLLYVHRFYVALESIKNCQSFRIKDFVGFEMSAESI